MSYVKNVTFWTVKIDEPLSRFFQGIPLEFLTKNVTEAHLF